MKAIRKQGMQSSLIHQRIRNASFVPLESHDIERFKYNLKLRVSKYANGRLVALNNLCNKIIRKVQLWTQNVNFKAIRNDVSTWLIEALIEGFMVNFIVWALIGWKFNLLTMLAWGFAVKQSLSIYWRLRKNGENSTIPAKDK